MFSLMALEAGPGRDKLEYIHSRYMNLMLFKAREILRDSMLAEDAVSEAFIRIYKNLDKIDDPSSNKSLAFIITIVKNAALTILKKENRYVLDGSDEPEDVRDPSDLEERVLSDLSAETIYRLVERLGEELRGVFMLRYAYDMPHREIAKLLGISENNVTVRLHRARKKLSGLLSKEGYGRE